MKRWILAGAVLVTAGCSDELESGEVVLVTGLEQDTWTADPPVVAVELDRVLEDGDRESVTTLEDPAGESPRLELTGPVSRFVATGVDAAERPVVRGHSFWLEPAGLYGVTVPMFVGRVGRFSRPGALEQSVGAEPALAVVGGRFLLAGGASGVGEVPVTGFDFGFWAPTTTESYQCSTAPCRVESMAVVANSVALLIGENWAYVRDFVTNLGSEFAVPEGLDSWGAVAGGQAVQVSDGSAYLVGGTRTEAPSEMVLRLHAEGEVEVVRLSAERTGAAATWVEERGLLVVGGSAEAPGVELLPSGSAESESLAFEPDPMTGAALIAFDESLVMRVGGLLSNGDDAPSVVFDLSCTSDCSPSLHSEAIGLDRAQAFRVDEAILVVGQDQAGFTAARLVTQDGVEPVELRERRQGARAIMNTLDQVVVVGGTLEDGEPVRSIELFML